MLSAVGCPFVVNSGLKIRGGLVLAGSKQGQVGVSRSIYLNFIIFNPELITEDLLLSVQGVNNESELLSGVANGDENAFRELMHTYQPLLLTYVFQLTKSVSVSEEIVQDVFLKVWMGRESLEGVHHFKNYLFIICRNYALDQLRKIVREREQASAWENEQERTEAAVPADNDEFFFTLLDEAVNNLPPQQQKVYMMARRQGLSHAEIARQTGLSVLTVKKYMKLAIAAITSYIKSQLPGVSIVLIAMAMGLENYF